MNSSVQQQSTLGEMELAPSSGGTFSIRLPGPLDVSTSLDLLRHSGDDLIDRWDGIHLVRTVRLGKHSFAYLCTYTGTIKEPAFEVTVEDGLPREMVEAVIRSTFLLPPIEFAGLLFCDPVIARLNTRYPGLRPVLQFDLLTALVRCISAQQVNLRWALTTRRRLAEVFGEKHQAGGQIVYSFSTDRLAAATVAEIRALQFTTRKAEYIISVAEAIAQGRVTIERLTVLPDEEAITLLTSIRGIGRWTAEWILARTLGRPCVVAGDLGVRKAVGLAYLGMSLPSEREVRAATSHWGASAGVAQVLLLHGYNREQISN